VHNKLQTIETLTKRVLSCWWNTFSCTFL